MMFSSKFGVAIRNLNKLSATTNYLVLHKAYSSKQPPGSGCPPPPVKKTEEDCERLFQKIKPCKDKKKSCEQDKKQNQRKSGKQSSCKPNQKDDNLCQQKPKETQCKDAKKEQDCKPMDCKKQDPCKKSCEPFKLFPDLPTKKSDSCKSGKTEEPCKKPKCQESPREGKCKKEDPCKKHKCEESPRAEKNEPCPPKEEPKDECSPKAAKPRGRKAPCNAKQFKRKSNIDPNKGGNICQKSKSNEEDMKMTALVFDPARKEVCLEQVKIPDHIKKDEVLIQVHYAGINATDFSILGGKIPTHLDKLIPGREFSGIVCGAGEKVDHVKAGDTVIVAPCQPTSVCKDCTKDKSEACVKDGGAEKALGVGRDGGWAEFSVVPGNVVYKAPQGTDPKEAALLPALAQVMCSLSKLKIEPCNEILILGGGLLGSLFALFLQHNGFENVSICEDNPQKVRQLECLCTGYPVINPSKIDCMALDFVITNGTGASTMQKALDALKPHGQFIILGPVGGNGCAPEMKVAIEEFSRKQINMQGVMGSPSNPSNIPIELICSALKDKIEIPVFQLAEYQEALNMVQTGDISHVLLQVRPERPRCPPTKKEK